jgi:ribosomal-protein-alanine N-acetyltransferase
MSALPQARLSRRALGVQDLEAVLNIEVRAYSHPWTRGNFIDSIASGYLCEGLWSDDQGVLGYFVAMAGVGELHLLNLTVDPAFQGQGHGSALLLAVQDRAIALGLATLWLEVRHGNERARALYRRRGFAEVGLRKGYYPAATGREDAVVMSLQCLTSARIAKSPTNPTVGPQCRDGAAADGLD